MGDKTTIDSEAVGKAVNTLDTNIRKLTNYNYEYLEAIATKLDDYNSDFIEVMQNIISSLQYDKANRIIQNIVKFKVALHEAGYNFVSTDINMADGLDSINKEIFDQFGTYTYEW